MIISDDRMMYWLNGSTIKCEANIDTENKINPIQNVYFITDSSFEKNKIKCNKNIINKI